MSQAHDQRESSSFLEGLGRGFASQFAMANGIKVHYVRGGQGPAIILIHGFPQDWFEYHAIMPALARQFTVIAVDLRGIGASTATPGGYDAANMAQDVCGLVKMLELERVCIVGHDIGGMVAYAFVRRYPEQTRGTMVLDVPLPGIEGWEDIQGDASIWHVRFMQVPGLAEKLVTGRSADYLDYFFQFANFSPDEKAHYVSAYTSPAQLHAAFEMYRAFPDDAHFNAAQRGPIDVPIFFGAGEKSPFAKLVPKFAGGLRANGCSHVETGLIPGAVHYVVQDQPSQVVDLIKQYASLPSQ
jgi:pimeloyl-ACP methyl ester carboxylesterase